MASAIDATKPVAGSPTTLSVRNNFATAASEITALQAAVAAAPAGDITGVAAGAGLTGGGTTGDLTLALSTPVSVPSGGTGATTLAATRPLVGNGTSAISASTAMLIQSGVQIGAPAGGDLGAGTINVASGYYVNGGGAAGVALLTSGNSYINSGNVGIGTTAPHMPLSVKGGLELADTAGLSFNSYYSAGWHYEVAGSAASIGVANGTMSFYVSPDGAAGAVAPQNGALVLASTGGMAVGSYAGANGPPANGAIIPGNVGIGTPVPGSKLTVVGGSVQNVGAAAVGAYNLIVDSGPNGADSTTTMALFRDFTAAVAVGAIVRTGTNNVQYTTASDERLKEAITDSKRGLDALMAIKVSDYKMGKTANQGLLAQDVAKVYPEAVHEGGKDPNLQPWMLDYGRLTPLLIKGMQQQQEMIAALQAKVAALESATVH